MNYSVIQGEKSKKLAAFQKHGQSTREFEAQIKDIEFAAIRQNLHIGNPILRRAIKRDEESRALERGQEQFKAFDEKFRRWERASMLYGDVCVTSGRRGMPDIYGAQKTRATLLTAATRAVLA